MEDFQDTTLGAQIECAAVEFFCINNGCNKKCKSTDEGINPHMKYCNACSIKLTADLSEALNLADCGEQHHNEPVEGPPIDSSDDRPIDNESLIDPPDDSFIDPPDDLRSDLADDLPIDPPDDALNDPPDNMSMADIEGAVWTLVRTRDTRQFCIIKIGSYNIKDCLLSKLIACV